MAPEKNEPEGWEKDERESRDKKERDRSRISENESEYGRF